MYIDDMYCILWTDICNSVDDFIFVLVFVLTLVQIPLYRPLPGLPNGHCALYPLGFVVAAGSALRLYGLSFSTQHCCLLFPCSYMCLCVLTLFYAGTYLAFWPS